MGYFSLLAFWIGGAGATFVAPTAVIRPTGTARNAGPIGTMVSGSPEGTAD